MVKLIPFSILLVMICCSTIELLIYFLHKMANSKSTVLSGFPNVDITSVLSENIFFLHNIDLDVSI